jgi:hypothetical protein
LRSPVEGFLLVVGARSVLVSGFLFGGFLLGGLIGVAVEEEVDGDLPGDGALDLTAEAEDLAGEEPVHHADGVAAAVVAGDGDVDVLEGGVGVAEGDDGDVDLGGFGDGLVVGAGVGDDDEAGLLELGLDLVGEGTGDEAAGGEVGAGVLGELEHGALTEEADGADHDVLRVLDGGDDAGGEDELLPGHVEVDDVDAFLGAGIDVLAHGVGDVLGAEVRVGSKEALSGGLRGVENLRSGGSGGHSFVVFRKKKSVLFTKKNESWIFCLFVSVF